MTKVYFKAQEAVAVYFPPTAGSQSGWDPVYEVDAIPSFGKKGWSIWIHETAPGNGVLKIHHVERPLGEVTVPLTSVRSYEERWQESPYVELLAREASEKKLKDADKLAASDKAAAKK